MTDIKKLADAVDEAEIDLDLVDADGWEASDRPYYDRFKAASDAYFAAIRKPWLDEQERLERYKVRISQRRLAASLHEMEAAARHLATFKDKDGWPLGKGYTEREYLDAEAANEAAECRHDIYYWEFWRAFHDAEERKPKRRKTVLVDGVRTKLERA